MQGRLVVLDLDDQRDAGLCGDLEMFFWQCSASSVTMAPAGTPSSRQQRLRRRDLVGLLGDVDMGEHEGGVGGERAQHLGRGTVVEVVEAAAQRLAIQRDAALSGRCAGGLQQRGMAAEDRLHRGRIEPLEDVADGGVRGRAAPLQTEGGVQPAAVDIDEGDDAAIRVATGDDGENGEQAPLCHQAQPTACTSIGPGSRPRRACLAASRKST